MSIRRLYKYYTSITWLNIMTVLLYMTSYFTILNNNTHLSLTANLGDK